MRFDASGYRAANVGGELMSEARDPAIKLFGRTIPLPETMPAPSPEDDGMDTRAPSEMMPKMAGDEKGFAEEMTSTEHKGSTNLQQELVQGKPNTQDDKATLDLKPEEDQPESDGSGQGKVLKKPDKIVPCPRCNSLDTKFCYYNNYNVNQPRHFCKNCQRYWTAGGTMRNVPVGAGRRKNKHSASHYRQMTIPSDGQGSTRVDAPDSSHHAAPCLKENGTVLKFGPEGPLCESMASVLNLREQKRNVDPSPMTCEEVPEEPSCASSVEASNTPFQIEQNNGVTPVHHLPCYSGPPWPYPWGGPPVMATIPFPFTPASFWGYMPGWTWVGANGGFSSASSTSNSGCSSNGSQTLGKHSRDVSSQVEDKAEKSLWVPKTLRIDDPDEAAKSSIWATLGIKPDEGGIFKDLRFKKEGKGHPSNSAQALLVNPAALSRSQSFREST